MSSNAAKDTKSANAQGRDAKTSADAEANATGGLPPEYDEAIAGLRDVKDKTAADLIQSGHAAGGIGENILKIPVKLEIVLGSLTMPVSQLMAMTKGEIISLDRNIGDGLEIHANGSRIGTGELIVADDHTGLLGVRITKLDNEG